MTQTQLQGGLAAVADAIGEAEETRAWLAQLAASDPTPGGERAGVAAGTWTPDERGLPPECPVIPLGVDGGVYWFLDTLGQLRDVDFSQFGQKLVNSLFMGRHHYLYWAWPRFNKEAMLVGWRQEKTTEDLMCACARKGPWNAVERARGRGAWRLADGRLALHCGTSLYVDGEEQALGEMGGDVYMTRPPVPKPWPDPIRRQGPAAYLYPILTTWHWARPRVDPVLMLGWIGAAVLGGALPWRPIIYMTGDKATGKSTLQKLMKAILGNALIKSADTTAAGIYQLLKSDSLPVAVDELEGKADTRKAKAIMELARLAASGDLMLRGGEAHSGVQFNARSCFAFSSIIVPPLEPQDLSRMALLRLRKLPEGTVGIDLDERELARVGRKILRQMVDGWPRFAETLRFYRHALARAGHDSRGQDTFGTLLACADILIGEDGPDIGLMLREEAEDEDVFGRLYATKGMIEYEDADEHWRQCLNVILTTPIDAWRGGSQQTLGGMLEQFFAGNLAYGDARDLAAKAGVSILKPDAHNPHYALFIPNQQPLLYRLLLGSKYAGEPGAGVWSGVLRQAPPDAYRVGQGRVNGVKSKGTAFNLDVVLARPGQSAKVKGEGGGSTGSTGPFDLD